MGSETEIVRMEDAPLQIIDGDRGKNYPSRNNQLDEGFCLFLNAGNVTTEGFKFEDTTFITKERDELLRKGKLRRKDIVITTRGTVGNVAFYDIKVPFEHIRINSGMVIIRTEENYLDPRYTYYFLKSRLFENQVQMLRTGSAQPQLPIRDINRIKIPIPSLVEQKRIAHILGTLDNKIELNQRMSETLEDIARAIFKSWFVDFDPVRAKINGEPYPLPDAVMALFPDELVESELGMIPKGWEVKSLSEIANFLNGTACQKFPVKSEKNSLPVLKIRELRAGTFDDQSDRASMDIQEKYTVKNGDVIFSWSGSLLVDIWTGGSGFLNQHLFKVTSKDYPKWFYYYWIKHHLDEFQRIAEGKATTMGHIKRNHLDEALVYIPNDELFAFQNSQMRPYIHKRITNDLEALNCMEMRNNLLEKLI